jgi:hypothetical protein
MTAFSLRDSLGEKKRYYKERLKSLTSEIEKDPIFIFGNQKSGTSAVVSLLGEASGERYIVDFVGAWEPYFNRVFKGDINPSQFIRRNRWAFSHKLIKEPNLTLISIDLMDYFSVEKSIFIVRNPFDNIRSILNRLRLKPHVKVVDIKGLVSPTWYNILSGVDLGLSCEYLSESLAYRWAYINNIYLENNNRFDLVFYEDFKINKRATIDSLLDLYGLNNLNSIEHLLNVNFQPKGDNSLSYDDYYGDLLDNVSNICLPVWESVKNGR